MKAYILKLTVVLLMLAGGFSACEDKEDHLKEGEYGAVCATINQIYANRDCWSILIESEEPIGTLNPIDGIFVFEADYLPDEFKVNNTRATITFRLTGESRQCGFGEALVVEVLTIKKCN